MKETNPMKAADASRTGHPEYSAGVCAWLDPDTGVQVRQGIIVQCPTVDHEHTDELTMKAELTEDPEVGLAWVVTAMASTGTRAMAAAAEGARGLAELLAKPEFRRG